MVMMVVVVGVIWRMGGRAEKRAAAVSDERACRSVESRFIELVRSCTCSVGARLIAPLFF